MKTLAISLVALGLWAPLVSVAEHKSAVAGQIIDSTDPNIRPSEDACDSPHYHGTLNGLADPNPNGCGHGIVATITHGDGDGESLPAAPEEKGWFGRAVDWVKGLFTKENAKNVIDVAAEANGIPPPGTVSDAVDITKEATPSIVEKTENIKEYRENVGEDDDTLGIYNAPSSGEDGDSLSQKFFKWFNNLVP